jgi:DNA-binding NarL/FixJ family response regulator
MTQSNGDRRGGRIVRVLIVDDDPYFRLAVATTLAQDENLEFIVGEAGDGHAALDAIERHEPDAVILDLRMPGTDGIAVAHEIAQRWPHVRVIMVTGYDSDEERERAQEAGIDTFLSKTSLADYRLSDLIAPG